MIQGLYETPIWQRVVLFGLVMVLFLWGMQTWVWDSLDRSAAALTQEIDGLARKNHESIRSLASLTEVEQDVIALREKFLLGYQESPARVEPQSFRRAVVNIGKRSGVSVRFWNPQKSLETIQDSDASLDIVVKVEGSFYDTVQFMNNVLQLSWVQTVNPLRIVRKQNISNASLVMTNFTLKCIVSRDNQERKKLLKT